MTRVKVCGVTTPADRDAVRAAGADAVGAISGVPVDTPRELSADDAATVLDGLGPFVDGVLVTMPRSVQAAVRRAEAVDPDCVQVHGGLDPDQVGGLARRLAVPTIAAVDATADPATLAAYAARADALLVDSADAAGGGGTGRTHDWDRTREVTADLDVPVVLAGGLDPDNVADAVDAVDPYAVDVASGVEAEPGRKDHAAVDAFVAAARGVAA